MAENSFITKQSGVDSPFLSIVTGTYNRFALLQQMFKSVRETLPRGIRYEFVITDAGSTDGTLEWLRKEPHVTLIEEGALRGAVKAFTDAARLARGRYVVMANDDVTFTPFALLRSLVHLENNPRCGGVAMPDNRPVPGKRQEFDVLYQAAQTEEGIATRALYAQVGVFRRWLGEIAGWWGGDDPLFKARTYGADNYLTSRILELGYTVDAVAEAHVIDYVAPDELRRINSEHSGERHPDSVAFDNRWPGGVVIRSTAQVQSPENDRRKLRVLYLPIFEPQYPEQVNTKQSMRNALAERFFVYEFPYTLIGLHTNKPTERRAIVRQQFENVCRVFRPDLILTQLHDAVTIDADTVAIVRAIVPRAVWVNWNGDYWPNGLVSDDMLKLLRYVDLQLTINASVLETYQQKEICAGYWQIGYEASEPYSSDVPNFDVVFMGNNYSQKRAELGEFLNTLGVTVGIYGQHWPESEGDTLYNFAFGEAVYKNSKIAIGDNQFTEAIGFVSNRIFQTLGAGGALLLHQRVEGLEALTGLQNGTHYVEWIDLDDLRKKIRYWLNPKRDKARKKITQNAQQFIQEKHTFSARLDELFDLLHVIKKSPKRSYRLMYRQPSPRGFGLMLPGSGKHAYYDGEQPLVVPASDAVIMMRRDSAWYEVEAETWQSQT